jgi:peptide chain release factor 1
LTLRGSGDRSERIRTYNFPQNRMTDHRVDLTLYSLDRIVEGALDPVLNALREKDLSERIAAGLGSI